ncbi:MAG: ferredoxin [Thermoprotei archaeon]|nr:MAG: ferredoxin [Thermoprotei archaeon]
MSVVVVFEPMGRRVRASPGTILEIAREGNVPLRSDCGGRGVCGKCRVVIVDVKGEISEVSEVEKRHLTQEELARGYRLACQVKVLSGCVVVFVPPESRVGVRKVVEGVVERRVELRPAVRKVHLKLPEPSLEDNRPDFERLRDFLGDVEIPLDLLRRLPILLREAKWDVTVVLWGNKLIGIEKGDTSNRVFGLAIDIGSSKIVCHLVDLVSGETVARGYIENPQVVYGEDVVSRITYASRSEENLRRLQRIVVDAINEVIDRLCKEAGVRFDEIYEAVVVGNSVMHHLFFGIYPKFIGVSPFTPAVRKGISYPAKEVGLRMNSEGYVTSLPLIAGFVGADATANLIVTKIHERDEVSMVIDIGTNTEILLGNRDRLLVCSAPSGPAFEGAHISHGMKAVSGAIERVKIVGDEVIYETIDNVKPRGICGSGMIDLVAELYRAGLINRYGKFIGESKRIVKDRIPRFVVAWADETETGKEITVTERDINELLLAKAAIRAGWMILMEKLGIKENEISRIYLAGSFGRHVDVENAKLIGLLPKVPNDRVVFVGDIAVIGAEMALKSVEERRNIEKVVNSIEYIELSADKNFYQTFIKAIPIEGE